MIRGLALPLLAVALSSLPAARDTTTPPAPDPAAVELTPVLRPSLERMDEAVRELLRSAEERLDGLLEGGEGGAAELAAAFGRLGELYLVYSLPEAAESCFVNAARLAPDRFRWDYLLGSVAQRSGDPERAREHLVRARAARPEDLPTRVRLAQIDLELGRLDAAEEEFSRLAETPGYEAIGRYGLGRIASERGDFAVAARHFEAVLAAQPEATVARYQLGLAYRDLGDVERSREHLAAWGRTEVTFPDPISAGLGSEATGAAVFLASGSRARAAGDLAAAVESFRRAVAEDPSHAGNRRVLATALMDAGQVEAAVAELREVLRLEPGDPGTLYNLGTALARRGETGEAIGYLRQAVAAAPDHADARVNLAALLEEEGSVEEAEALYARALELDPYDLELRARLASVRVRRGLLQEALPDLEAVLEKDPDNVSALLALAAAREMEGRAEEAAGLYRRVLGSAGSPDVLARARLALARPLLDGGRAAEAAEHLRAAVETLPDSLELRLLLGAALGRMGDYAGAAEQLREASRIEPRDQQARFGRAIALLLAGREVEAKDHLEESLEVVPDSLPVRHLLARVLAAAEDARARDGARALALARQVFERQPTLDHAETVAMAYAELGRFEEAAEWQAEVGERARGEGQTARLEIVERRRALYERQQAVRSPWADRP